MQPMTDPTRSTSMWIGAGIALLAVAAFVFGWSIPSLRKQAFSAAGQRIEVSFVDAPQWMTSADLAPLQEMVAREAGASAYDRVGLERAQAALLATGWFETVRQVRRERLTLLEVEGTFAQPTAVVADSAGDHLLDSECRLLPRTYALGTAPKLPRIVGARLPRPPRPGQLWTGADLFAGVELAKLVGTQRWRSQIAGVDVADFQQQQTLTLLTSGGCRVKWGRALGLEASAEVPAEQKLRYLDLLHNQYGRIDGAGPNAIDLSVDYVASH